MNLLIFLALMITQIFAWWEVGHMLTAQVAKTYLQDNNPEVLAWADNLVQDFNLITDGRSNTFVEASVWADDIKESGTDFLDNFHFTDHPINPSGLMIVIETADIQVNSMDLMRRARLILTNKKTINLDHTWAKAQMIRYVLHVIGDMHQPLHNSNFYNATYRDGDLGGNLINLINLDGSKVNLHAFWDSGALKLQPNDQYLVRPLNKTAISFMEQWANQKMLKYPFVSFSSKRNMGDPSTWTFEGYQEAIDIAYPFLKDNSRITKEYQDLVYSLCEGNIVLGGYRLATYLTDVYQSIQLYKQQMSFIESKFNLLHARQNGLIKK